VLGCRSRSIAESSTLTGVGTACTSVARRVAVTVTAPSDVDLRAAVESGAFVLLEGLFVACCAPATEVTKTKAAAVNVTRAAEKEV
jgi:hypothetical protein